MSVPQDWTAMITHLNDALVARPVMNNPHSRQIDRDLATDRYVHAVDAIIDCLVRLREQMVLGRITMLLSKKERS